MTDTHNIDDLETLGGERGIPSVNEHSGVSSANRALIFFGLIVFIAIACGLAYWKTHQKEVKAAVKKELQISGAPAKTFSEPPPLPEDKPEPKEITAPVAVTAQPPPIPGEEDGHDGRRGRKAPVLDKSGSNLMVGNPNNSNPSQSSNETHANGASANATAAGAPLGAQVAGALVGGSQGLGSSLTATQTPPRTAGFIGNRNFILAKGSFIDCALQTRLDSTIPGMTACVITRNIYSDNGKVLLLERGATVSGEYQSNMKQGMARIGVLWNRIKTPNGVIINLDSPGTDPLGGAGVPGYIDTHFWERFGGALMLSIVDDVAQYAVDQAEGGDTDKGQTINFSGTAESTQDMATEALKNTINIPPTLYKNQGEKVGIYIARDLDFSSVYDVRSE